MIYTLKEIQERVAPIIGKYRIPAMYCDLEAAFEKEIDIITVGAIMQEPAMPSDMDFKNTILNERVQLHDVA